MKLIEFLDYNHYVKAQKSTVMRRGMGPYFTDAEMEAIGEWSQRKELIVKRGICHGARNGLEADELMNQFPGSTIFGTDLFPYSGKSSSSRGKAKVIEWDFGKPHSKWKGRFDLIYSNSLDHAQDPIKTLAVWYEQLTSNGALFIQWNRSDVGVKSGDCFGAELSEYIALMNVAGRVVDLLYTNVGWDKSNRLRRKGLEAITVVGKRRS